MARTYTYDQLAARVGRFLGYGSTSGNWSAEESAIILDCINTGLTWFYEPPGTPNNPAGHEWRFLCVNDILTTSTEDTTLPEVFGGIDGEMTRMNSGGLDDCVVHIVGEDYIRYMRESSDGLTGDPYLASVRPKTVSGSATQRFELQLFPNPNGTQYSFRYRYRIQPPSISGSEQPYGGAAHGDTVLAACLAAADSLENDNRGEKWQIFMERLEASIRRDQTANVREYYGYNSDRSDDNWYDYYPDRDRHLRGGTVTLTTSSSSSSGGDTMLETDRVTMTGSEVTYSITGGIKSLAIHALDGDVTVRTTSGGDAFTISEGVTLPIFEDGTNRLDTQDIYLTGTNLDVVEVIMQKDAT